MSHRAVSGAQFGEQLKMFMSPDEIIDRYHKGDSAISATPREEWESPGSGYEPGTSLKGSKLSALAKPSYQKNFDRPWVTAPPVKVFANKHLGDGHHRLAYAEKNKIPFMAVRHYE